MNETTPQITEAKATAVPVPEATAAKSEATTTAPQVADETTPDQQPASPANITYQSASGAFSVLNGPEGRPDLTGIAVPEKESKKLTQLMDSIPLGSMRCVCVARKAVETPALFAVTHIPSEGDRPEALSITIHGYDLMVDADATFIQREDGSWQSEQFYGIFTRTPSRDFIATVLAEILTYASERASGNRVVADIDLSDRPFDSETAQASMRQFWIDLQAKIEATAPRQ